MPTTEDEARKIALDAMPGWEVVHVKSETGKAENTETPESDAVGADLDELRANYAPEASEARRRARAAGEDVYFVTLKPTKAAADHPIKTRKVLVTGKKLVGFQG